MKLSLLLLFLALGSARAGLRWLTPEARLNAAARRGDVARPLPQRFRGGHARV